MCELHHTVDQQLVTSTSKQTDTRRVFTGGYVLTEVGALEYGSCPNNVIWLKGKVVSV